MSPGIVSLCVCVCVCVCVSENPPWSELQAAPNVQIQIRNACYFQRLDLNLKGVAEASNKPQRSSCLEMILKRLLILSLP